MIFHQILSDPVSDFGKGPKRGFILDLFSAKGGSNQYPMQKGLVITSEVKCHTILEMGRVFSL